MRSEGFLFLSGGLGGGSCLRRVRPSVRKRPHVSSRRCADCAVGIGEEQCLARRVCVGNGARRLKPLDFVALREKSRVRALVDV